MNGGQNCSANMRQIIDVKIKDDFLDKVLKKTKTLKVGDPLNPKTEMGSMISDEHLKRLMDIFLKALKREQAC